MLSLLVICFLAVQVFLSTNQNIVNQLSTPLGPQYTTDMRAFLKTYQLMEQGQNFYPAFYQGMSGLRSGYFRPDINAWRQPFIFYFWKLLPGNGASIYLLWQLFILAIFISAFLITKNWLSPILVWPYLHYSLTDLTMLQPEWWGMAFLVFGLVFLVKEKHFLAGTFFALALACREPFAVTIFPILIYKRNFRLFLPVLVYLVYFAFIHLPNILSFWTTWFRDYANGNWKTLHFVFAYASWEYPLGVYRPFIIIFAVSVISFLLKRRNFLFFLTFFPFFIFTTIMAVLGKIDSTRDYWSIYFIPLLLISAPALIFPPGKK